MSIQAVAWVLENSESELGPRHVMISIANHADRNGLNAWPTVATIAREAKLSERAVQYAIPQLIELGELAAEKGAGPNGAYKFSLPKMWGANFAGGGVQTVRERGANSSSAIRKNRPEPSLTPYSPPFEDLESRTRVDRQGVVSIQPPAEIPPDPKCGKCHGSGSRQAPGHPGRRIRCNCTYPREVSA